MKEKIKEFVKENKGNISLFLITMIITLVVAIIGGSIAGGCLGTLTLLGIDYTAGKVGMQLGDSDRPGISGIVIGLLLSLI